MRIIQAQISIKPSHFLWAQRWTLQLAGGLHEQIRCSEWLYRINKLQKSVSEKYSPSTHEIDADFPRNWELTTKFLSEVLTLLPKISGSTNEQTGTHDHSSFTSRQSGLAQDYCHHEGGNLQQGHSSKQLGQLWPELSQSPRNYMSKFQFQRRTLNPSIKENSWTVMTSHKSSTHYKSTLRY